LGFIGILPKNPNSCPNATPPPRRMAVQAPKDKIQMSVAYQVMAFCSREIQNIMPKGRNYEYYHPLEIFRTKYATQFLNNGDIGNRLQDDQKYSAMILMFVVVETWKWCFRGKKTHALLPPDGFPFPLSCTYFA
jgi:hypothetical protein